jgi:hypothetical protein
MQVVRRDTPPLFAVPPCRVSPRVFLQTLGWSCLTVLLLSGAAAPEPAVPPHAIRAAAGSITIDGDLSDPGWNGALTLPLDWEVMPGENIPAPVRTELRVTHDRDRLYAAFVALDPDPSAIRAHLADRDTPGADDYVGIMLDPFNGGRRGYTFVVTAAGVQMDIARNEVGERMEDLTWDAIWECEARITEDGYRVEMAIPFREIRFPKGQDREAMTWGVAGLRSWPRDIRHQMATVPFDRDNGCVLCQIHQVTGFAGISPGRNLELTPTWTANRSDERTGVAWEDGPSRGEAGLSVRWGITPGVSANAAINPDFSQVEADELAFDINRRFAVFYGEKRPFFMEGADLFETPERAVHTRMVADPAWGVKLSGKSGATAFGGFVARDELTGVLFPSNQGSGFAMLEGGVTDGALRIRRDVGTRSTAGVLLTARDAGAYRSLLAGADGLFRLEESTSLRWQFLGSETRYPAEMAEEQGQPVGAFRGSAVTAKLLHDSRNWSAWSEIVRRDARFRADLGFVPQVDMLEYETGVWRKWIAEPGRWWTEFGVGVEVDRVTDISGRLTDRGVGLEVNLQATKNTWLWAGVSDDREWYDGRAYDMNFLRTHGGFRPTGDLFIGGGLRGGGAIDYEHGRPATRFGGGPRVEWDITDRVHLLADLTHEELDADGEKLYTANFLETRLVGNFSRRAFVRGIVHFRHVTRNPANHEDPDTEERELEVFTQLLFSYKVNPRTVLFLGYDDNAHGDLRTDLARTDRTFFVKLGYAWTP